MAKKSSRNRSGQSMAILARAAEHEALAQVMRPTERCVAKSKADEPLFTLCARDVTAPGIVRAWAIQAARMGSPAHKVGEALIGAAEMERWQARHGSKVPD